MADYPEWIRHRVKGRVYRCNPSLAQRIGIDFDPVEEPDGVQEEGQTAQETLTDLHWREIKRRVEAHGFEFTNKADGVELLTKLANGDPR